MEYKYVFMISYGLAFLVAIFFLGQRTHQAVNSMKEMGMGSQQINDYHRMMRWPTIIGAIQATIITGTAIGLVGSAINFLFR
ncbi:hypothetical protein [Phytobacter sp. AG2a]